jgi:hypothetical protein
MAITHGRYIPKRRRQKTLDNPFFGMIKKTNSKCLTPSEKNSSYPRA